MVITVASGKGGTGKTTVATSLAVSLADQSPVLLDCDVEAPNAHLYLNPRFEERLEVTLQVPTIAENSCSFCGRCAEVCQFNAIVVTPDKVLLFPELCHGCGSCAYQCDEGALIEQLRGIGWLESGEGRMGIRIQRGILNIGEPMAVPIIRKLKQMNDPPQAELEIRDAPPGTSCPVVETMRGSDYILLVTEPTPFGLHDLKLALELTRILEIPAGVVLNREGVGDDGVDAFCLAEGVPILMRIPFDERIALRLSTGGLLIEEFPEFAPRFRELYSMIKAAAKVMGREGANVKVGR
jgi:MinD superfamily P-loop ATPase